MNNDNNKCSLVHNTLRRNLEGVFFIVWILFFILLNITMLSDFEKNNLLYDLFEAYQHMKVWKANKKSIIAFELHLETEILKLYQELIDGTYKISPYTCFLIYDPVPREIFAPHIRDRIVHHFLYKQLCPITEKIFLHNSYACRKDKWTHYAIREIKKMMRAVSDNYTQEARISKNDISSYFMSIDKHILWNLVTKILDDHHQGISYPIRRFGEILKSIIFHDPTKNYYRIGDINQRKKFPQHKSLFASKPWTGLPLWNLTSQIFANIYLHELDVFVTQTLGIKHYGRYMDDFILFHTNKKHLQQYIKDIEVFLKEHLKLQLHPHKRYFQEIKHGLTFCGVRIHPYYITPRIRTIGRRKKRLYERKTNPPKSYSERVNFRSTYNSYLGMMKHRSTYRLRKYMLELLPIPRWNHILRKSPFTKISLRLKQVKKKFKKTFYIFYKLFWW